MDVRNKLIPELIPTLPLHASKSGDAPSYRYLLQAQQVDGIWKRPVEIVGGDGVTFKALLRVHVLFECH